MTSALGRISRYFVERLTTGDERRVNTSPDGTSLGSITTSQAYSTFGEVSQFAVSWGGSALLDVQYTRDNLGRVTGKTETVQGVTATYSYGYDPAGRLTEVKKDGAVVSQYAYDSYSNRKVDRPLQP